MEEIERDLEEIWAKARRTLLRLPPAKAGGNSKERVFTTDLPRGLR